MGFSSDALRPTATRLLCRIQVVAWLDWRASAIAKFLTEARARLTELLETLPVDGSSFRKLEEQMRQMIGGCLDAVTAAARISFKVPRDAIEDPSLLSDLLVRSQTLYR